MDEPGENCSVFEFGDHFDYSSDDAWMTLMRCPKCGGWLPRDFPIGRQFQCKNCKIVLETIPDMEKAKEYEFFDMLDDPEDYDDDDIYEAIGGKLCIVPDYAVKKDE